MSDSAMAWWYNLSWPVRGTIGTVPGVIERVEDLSTTYKLKSASIKKKKKKTKQTDIYGKPGKKVKVQYVKAKLEKQEITFSTTYHVATGTLDIQGKIEEIRDMIGSTGPLVFGRTHPTANSYPRVFGMFDMRLTEVAVSGVAFDDLGRMLSATVNFTLKQVKKKKFRKQAAKFPGESAKEVLRFWTENPKQIPKEYESAVKMSPDKNVKEMWKKRKEDKK